MPDLSTYQPPGVYVQDVSQPYANVLNPTLTSQILCLVAPAIGYQTATQTINLYSATATALSYPGVVQGGTLVVTDVASGTVLTLNTDYSVSVNNADPNNPITSLTRLPSTPGTVSPNGLPDGGAVSVSYEYTDSEYYQPQLFSDYGSVVSTYGDPLATSASAPAQVTSPMALAAKIAFENGASQILCVAVTGTSESTWETAFVNAYAMVATNPSVGVIVPIFPAGNANSGATLNPMVADIRSHVDQAYSNGFPRMAIISGDNTFNTTTTPFEQVAEAAADKRVVAVFPTQYQMFNPNISQTITVSGCYAAAALGARLVRNPVDRGLTRQVLNDPTAIPASVVQTMSASYMNNLAKNGVTVLMMDRLGRLIVRQGVTTDPSTQINSEISLVRTGDTLLVDVQQALDNSGLIGSPITVGTPVQVESILVGALEQEITNNVILAYGGVSVQQQTLPSGNPTVIDCTFSYRPAAPLNYITVEFSLDMNLGNIVPATSGTTPGTQTTSVNQSNPTG